MCVYAVVVGEQRQMQAQQKLQAELGARGVDKVAANDTWQHMQQQQTQEHQSLLYSLQYQLSQAQNQLQTQAQTLMHTPPAPVSPLVSRMLCVRA